ncbi:MAG TPA: prolyl oligopeptidase family serine peptidase [Chloroflexota bacterium]|nr:prolyl oligopeptidase family serine peptidase [Chloroflexota bacterium]
MEGEETVEGATVQEQVPGYRLPPPAMVELADAPETPDVSVSPDGRWLLLMERPGLPPIAELAQPELRLAGLRLNPRTNGPSRARYYTSLRLLALEGDTPAESGPAAGQRQHHPRPIEGLPGESDDGAGDGVGRWGIAGVAWSPDSARLAFTVTTLATGAAASGALPAAAASAGASPGAGGVAGEPGVALWVAEVATGRARLVGPLALNAAYGAPFRWASDSKTLLCRVVPGSVEGTPARASEPPAAPLVPTAPVIQESLGKVAPAWTFQDLLQNAHDEALFDYYLLSQVVRVSLDPLGGPGARLTPLGEPGLFKRADPSPDGRYLLVERVHRPYSYLVPLGRFPSLVEVWDATSGALLRRVADLPLAEEVPAVRGAVPVGPRSFGWRADAPATLYWAEAQDAGDPRREAATRDRVYSLEAPFDGQPAALATLELRYGGLTWGNDGMALVEEWWWKTRRRRTWVIAPRDPQGPPHLLFDRSWEDRYHDPGRPLLRPTPYGSWVLLTAGDAAGQAGRYLFLAGNGASPEGDRPFLDRLDRLNGRVTRLWRSQPPYFERPIRLLDLPADGDPATPLRLLTRRESVSEAPNYYLRHLTLPGGEEAEGDAAQLDEPRDGRLEQLTAFPHPAPALLGVHKELIRYQRADGVPLTATLYLPPGYKPQDGPLPMLMWAYPFEFKSADAAGQVTDSPHRFVRVSWSSPLFWLLHGFAVLDSPTMPIVGEGEAEPNDTYIEQLVASAEAAVEEVVRRGVADRERIAIGGHSYGAFMTANLLAHSRLFRAGIARSGAYNRTLTPFGFQAEDRTLWEAADTYLRMSPFMHADKIKQPLLLIHGAADNNAGTYPLQSERFYNALKGHGAIVRLVLLPHESHGYQARESIMHMLWEMTTWLDRYVASP